MSAAEEGACGWSIARIIARLITQVERDRTEIQALLPTLEKPPMDLGETLEDVANVLLDCADEISQMKTGTG